MFFTAGNRNTVTNDAAGEMHNNEAVTHIIKIERRISGLMTVEESGGGLPLSVQGQVDYLIREATSKANLSQMWVAFSQKSFFSTTNCHYGGAGILSERFGVGFPAVFSFFSPLIKVFFVSRYVGWAPFM